MARTTATLLAFALALASTACSSDEPAGRPEQVVFGGDRPVQISFPRDFDNSEKTPLLVVLHGYAVSGYLVLALTGLRDLVDEANVLIVAPEGVIGNDGQPSWNIEGTCCNQHDTDDVAYIVGLVEEISSVYNVDRDRVYVFGHSNGGTMAYHLGCERPDVFAGIASLAGPTPSCTPDEAVSILHIHGTEDADVKFDGGNFSTDVPYPSALGGLEDWAEHDGCGDQWEEGAARDLDLELAGDDTVVTRNTACPEGIDLELWAIEGAGHAPAFQDGFRGQLFDWLRSHSK